jgi:hypothetical protein
MPNVSKIVKGVAKAVGKKKAAAANKKGLKAAQGPSKAPKGYKPDTTGRKAVQNLMDDVRMTKDGKKYYTDQYYTAKEVRQLVSNMRSTAEKPAFRGAVKLSENVVSRSGRKANTPRMMKKAAKKAK